MFKIKILLEMFGNKVLLKTGFHEPTALRLTVSLSDNPVQKIKII